MLNKTWSFGLALAVAAAPISSLLAAGTPNGENATAGTAAANASTPAAKMGSDAILVLSQLKLGCPDKPGPQQVQIGSPIHLSLDQFELCVLSLGLTV